MLVFMVAAVAGADRLAQSFRCRRSAIHAARGRGVQLTRLERHDAVAAATFAAELIGVVILSLIGWAFLRGLGRLYLWHLISDQSVLIDSLWFLFALTRVVDFAFFGGLWFLAPLGVFAIYKLIAVLGFALVRRKAGRCRAPSCSCCACLARQEERAAVQRLRQAVATCGADSPDRRAGPCDQHG